MNSYTIHINKHGVICKHLSSGRVYAAMDAKTRDFLAKFKSKLDRLFSKELSAVYLDKMGDHLETFYDDVNDELDTKHINMAKKVDGNF